MVFDRSVVRFAFAAIGLAAFVAVGAAWQPAPTTPAQPQPSGQPGQAGQGGQGGQPGQRGPGGPGGQGGRGGGGAERGDRGPVNIEAAMKSMNRGLKQLQLQVTDAAKKEDSLRLINDVQRNCVGAKGSPLPPNVLSRAKDDAERARWSQEYRKQMLATLRLLIDVEQDIMDDLGAQAVKKLDQIAKLRAEGHKLMGVHDD